MMHSTRAFGILSIFLILAIGCSSTEELHLRPLYSIDKYSITDEIQRPVFREQLVISKELEPTHHAVVTLEKYVHHARAIYSIDVYFVGQDWRYMKDITLNINGEQKTLTDEDPVRIRKSGDTVIESLTCLLDRDAFMGLRYCKSLEIQYDHKPIIIPQKGLEAIWKFLKE